MIKDSELDRIIKTLNNRFSSEDKINRWLLIKERLRDVMGHTIKRTVLLKNKRRVIQRLPMRVYKTMTFKERKDLVTRLNYSLDRDNRFKVKFKANSAFLPNEYLENFFELLKSEAPAKGVADQNYVCFKKHALDFFLSKASDPRVWKLEHEIEWAKHLLALNLSPRSLRRIIQVTNRFMKFLNERRPNEFPFILFRPVSKATFKKYSSEWEKTNKTAFRHYISEKDYQTILEAVPKELKSIFILCFKFGLRRSEALGLYDNLHAVRKDYLLVERQLVSFNQVKNEAIYGSTKNRKSRKVNYWFSSPKEAYSLIEKIVPMSPGLVTKKFNALMQELEMKYVIHDCRHTFITNAVNTPNRKLSEVMAAVGHSDLRVTSGYMKDPRGFSDEIWTPDKAS